MQVDGLFKFSILYTTRHTKQVALTLHIEVKIEFYMGMLMVECVNLFDYQKYFLDLLKNSNRILVVFGVVLRFVQFLSTFIFLEGFLKYLISRQLNQWKNICDIYPNS